MTHAGHGGGEPRLGARPAGDATPGCATCGHPFALHSNGTTGCKAWACTAGPDGAPCPEFKAAEGERLAS
jgi:hypothetical protein